MHRWKLEGQTAKEGDITVGREKEKEKLVDFPAKK